MTSVTLETLLSALPSRLAPDAEICPVQAGRLLVVIQDALAGTTKQEKLYRAQTWKVD